MPYLSPKLVTKAVEEGLAGRPPLAVVTLPALLRVAKRTGTDPMDPAGVVFGSGDERQLLEDYFQLPRPPEGAKPFKGVWHEEGEWYDERYPGRTLQRTRKDWANQGQVFRQISGTKHRWALLPDAGATLRDRWADAHAKWLSTVRLIDLAIWFGKNRTFDDLDGVMDWFTSEFAPDRGDLIGTIYDADIPVDYRSFPMVDDPFADEDYEAFGSLPPALRVDAALDDLVSTLEARVVATRFILPSGMVRRVLTAWLRGDLVVLVGPPGTGKTRFAVTLAEAMTAELGLADHLLIPIRSDFDETEFLGYERLDGTPQLREFARQVLQTHTPLEPHVVILEEFNLATIESYLAGVLVAAQEPSRSMLLPGEVNATLPVDAFVIATCNSYRDEPETRTRISAPTKRRATVITMPNVLWLQVDQLVDGVDDAEFASLVVGLAVDRIRAEADQVAARSAQDKAATFDKPRLSALSSVTDPSDLSELARDRLVAVVRAILTTAEGRTWFTLGLLRDVALALAFAERNEDSEAAALVEVVADKLVHQLRGPHGNADYLLAAVVDLPGGDAVADLLERMKEGPVDELLPLV